MDERVDRQQSDPIKVIKVSLFLLRYGTLKMERFIDPGFVQIGIRLMDNHSGIRVENCTRNKIEKGIRIKMKSRIGTEIENWSGVENGCGVDFRNKSLIRIGLKSRTGIEIDSDR
ncbi:hypothetical protein EVAR_24568_1 [Eumeta japonica]|uniref:Uncharacterized protein n=1 Tax=Eumeta variegata TaxID=151549 RepID=A0A4C1W527_EUMVA|nr:hypothetical protein EVAR_24568_1 [Eumeta japonica]